MLDVRGLLPSLCEAVGGVSCGVVAVSGGGWRCWWRRWQRRFFGLSVKGSSMLSIAKECRGGRLLSRHKAWWREGEQKERGGAQKEASRSHFLFLCCCYLRGNVFFLLFRYRKCFTAIKVCCFHRRHHYHYQLKMGRFGFVLEPALLRFCFC